MSNRQRSVVDMDGHPHESESAVLYLYRHDGRLGDEHVHYCWLDAGFGIVRASADPPSQHKQAFENWRKALSLL
jgi:hypothetical protein